MDSNIKTIVVKFLTDKPVRKTPYQVKGVFIRNFKNESIVPMLDGSKRDKFLYPRVQVKILDEQIYLIGIDEGVSPVLEISEKIEKLDFGNITFQIQDRDISQFKNEFISSNQLIDYEFITPWVALNNMTGKKYNKLEDSDKHSYLTKLIGQNIIFIAKELNLDLGKEIYIKLELSSLVAQKIDEKNWGSFKGTFKTNCILPNYIGLGNGITRGLGTIFYDQDVILNNSESSENQGELLKNLAKEKGLEAIDVLDVPKPKRKNKRKSSFKKKSRNKLRRNKNKKPFKSNRRVHNENYNILENNEGDNIDQKNYNTEEHHKRQHKF